MLNGDGLRVVLWVSGCNHCCEECQNPITWDPNGGIPFNQEAKEELFKELGKSYVSGITLSGGDPLHPANRLDIRALLHEIREKFPTKTIWLYTGYLWEQISHFEVMQYVDVCIGNEEDAELCLGFKPDADVEGGKTDAEGYKGIFKAMAKEFGFKYVISTLRESFSATHNGWKAMIYNGEEFYESKRYDINPIVDRVGGGDSFSGGIIHGLLTKPNQGAALEFAVAASALKHTINGDFNLVSVDEVEALAGGDASGRVQR